MATVVEKLIVDALNWTAEQGLNTHPDRQSRSSTEAPHPGNRLHHSHNIQIVPFSLNNKQISQNDYRYCPRQSYRSSWDT
jgi:hypothetical protein